MSRPRKMTLDFFLHDASASSDRKIRGLTKRHGNDGYATFFRLLEKLCLEKGVKLDLSDSLDLEIVAEDCNLRDVAHLHSIIETCCDLRLFDRQLWQAERIVFSHGLYDRYIARLEERKRDAERKQTKGSKKIVEDLQTHISAFSGQAPVVFHPEKLGNPNGKCTDPDPKTKPNSKLKPSPESNSDPSDEDVPVAQPQPEVVEAELVEESEPASALPRSGQIDRYENPGMSRAEKMEARMNKDLYPWRFVSQEEGRAFTEFLAKQGQRKGESLAKAQAIAVQQINNANHSDPNTKDHGRILGLWQLFKENMTRSQSLTEVVDGAMSPVMRDLTTHVLSKIQSRRAAG